MISLVNILQVSPSENAPRKGYSENLKMTILRRKTLGLML
jgi:hypothetical protein